MCRIGGVRSFAGSNVESIGAMVPKRWDTPSVAEELAKSSASTLGRFESDEDYESREFQSLVDRLTPSVAKVFAAASSWIENKNIDALVVFNCRMDATRAIFEAGRALGRNVLSLERTWFGDGLQILPNENCLGLSSVHRLVEEWSRRPLTESQAMQAANLIASRFLRRNDNEWRAYNVNARDSVWPVESARHRILLIPGSRNEIWGHDDWESEWAHPVDAYDAVMKHFELTPEDVVMRCHPNWAENIGKADGHLAESHYASWATSRGVRIIPSSSTVSTLSLIEQADAVVVGAGSAGLEAGALGKQIVGISPSNYAKAGMRDEACSKAQLSRIRLRTESDRTPSSSVAASTMRHTLRFAYTIAYRIPQFVAQVVCQTPTSYKYKGDADPSRLTKLAKTAWLEADDSEYAQDQKDEDRILALMRDREWKHLYSAKAISRDLAGMQRRWQYRWVDALRATMRHGDR